MVPDVIRQALFGWVRFFTSVDGACKSGRRRRVICDDHRAPVRAWSYVQLYIAAGEVDVDSDADVVHVSDVSGHLLFRRRLALLRGP